ncbi:hypothetical protein Ancab_000676 [Ancistrocladus abbreviatus]
MQSRDFFSRRLSQARAQAIPLQNSVDGSTHHDMHSGRFHGISLGLNQAPGYEQLQPCSSVSNIGYDTGCTTFMDIANSSTQAILAACGIEHRRSEVYEVQPPICVHIEGSAEGQMRFMKGCCQSCFDSFVKDVVRKIMDIRVPQWLGFRH